MVCPSSGYDNTLVRKQTNLVCDLTTTSILFSNNWGVWMFDHTFINALPKHQADKDRKGPLQGLLVLDFTYYIAGPLATMLLADLGATVIKFEPPRGDRFRSYPPHSDQQPEEGAAFLWANRNKYGLEADLKHPEGIALIKKLIKQTDIVIENFATGVMDRLGLGYEALSALNPQLVYCSISAYGSKGKFAKRPGFDSVVQAESGFVSLNGYPDRPGVRSSSSVMDIGTALLASNGILAALYEREKLNKGKHVEVSLYGSGLLMTGYASMQTLCTATSPTRFGNTSPDSCPTGVFECQDSSFFLHCGNNEIFQRLMTQVLGLEDVAQEDRFQTAKGRLQNKEELFALISKKFAQYEWHTLKALLEQAKVPAGEVRDLKTALLSEESMEDNLVGQIPHPTLCAIPNLRMPIKFDGQPLDSNKSAPIRGEDTLTVLKDIANYSAEEIESALKSGAFYVSIS